MGEFKSIMYRSVEDSDYCYICGHWGGEWHHIMNGAFRERSEEDRLMIRVHRQCHQFIHEHPVTAWNLKRKAQRNYERYIGTHEQWMERYKTDYLASLKPIGARNEEG